MARGMTRVVMVGNLGGDPEMKYSQGGNAVTRFRLAVGRWDGQSRSDVTDWYSVTCFGKQAENANEWLRKGDRVQVDGRLQLRAYTDRQGVERQSVDVIADGFLNLTERERERTATAAEIGNLDTDDVPF